MSNNTVQSDNIKAMEDRIKRLEGYFNAPEITLAMYEGERVSILIGRPTTTDPLVYPAKYVDGDKAGTAFYAPHDALTFLDPVRVTTEGYIRGLLDRIKELEDDTRRA